jgi:hypothetical protein
MKAQDKQAKLNKQANGAILVFIRTQPLSQPSPGHFTCAHANSTNGGRVAFTV